MDVACIGILVADLVGKPIDEMPEKGKLALVPRMELHTGGCAVNTGMALAKAGLETAVIGKVGQDAFGDFIISHLNKNNINVDGVKRDGQASTSCTMVLVDSDGERTFLHHTGANSCFVTGDVNLELFPEIKILHVGGTFLMDSFDGQPTADLLQEAKNKGITTSLDTAWDNKGRWLKLIKPCLKHIDIFLPSYEEARMISGAEEPEAIADFFLKEGVGTIALKMGPKGSYIKNANEKMKLSPHSVKVVDGTGAGDCFVAGFLTGYLKELPLEETGRIANAAGSKCAAAIGAAGGLCTYEELVEFAKKAS